MCSTPTWRATSHWFRTAKPIPGADDPDARASPNESPAQTGSPNGVPLPDEVWESILASARGVGINEQPAVRG